MKPIWFIHQGGAVIGPLDSVEIERRLGAGTLAPECLIWTRGSNEWMPISDWKKIEERVVAGQAAAKGRIWYCDAGSGKPTGPLTESELTLFLKGYSRLEAILIWGTGLKRWTPLFEVPEVMDIIGISRRENPRAPLLGNAAVMQIGLALPAQLLPTLSVSIGGLGVKNAGHLSPGEKVQISIQSRDLVNVVRTSGTVLYVSKTGEAGLRFDDPTAEMISIVHDHVRRFGPAAKAAA